MVKIYAGLIYIILFILRRGSDKRDWVVNNHTHTKKSIISLKDRASSAASKNVLYAVLSTVLKF